MNKAQERLSSALDAIGRGEFPPSPDDVYRCETCSFAAVCRKDYVDVLTRRRAGDAVDPSRNVVLEASAGTGKTRVLVERYVNLLRAGVEPEHILAITFTRKAAAEMRERIVERLREASRTSELDRARWRELKERFGDIAISTIDAFCLSLLREFPLEADVDPGFDLAADTEVPRLISESLTQTLRICRALRREDDDVALVFAQLGERRLRSGLASLIDRRLVAPEALRRYLARGPRQSDRRVCLPGRGRSSSRRPDGRPRRSDVVSSRTARSAIRGSRCWPTTFARSPTLSALRLETRQGQAAFRALIDRLRGYFLTQDGRPRGEKFGGTGFNADDCAGDAAWKRHRLAAAELAPAIADVDPGVPARSQRHHVARGLAHLRRRADAVPPDAGGARAA